MSNTEEKTKNTPAEISADQEDSQASSLADELSKIKPGKLLYLQPKLVRNKGVSFWKFWKWLKYVDHHVGD